MIYEILIFLSLNGSLEYAGSKTLPTEAACIAEGEKIGREMKPNLGDGITFDFKCEERPDGFARESDTEAFPPSADRRSAPAPVRTPATAPRNVPISASDRTQIVSAIRQKMIDPDSLRVSSIIMYPPINGVKGACAVINAKNSFGGYTGNQSIIIYHENGRWRAGSASDILDCNAMRQMHRYHATGE